MEIPAGTKEAWTARNFSRDTFWLFPDAAFCNLDYLAGIHQRGKFSGASIYKSIMGGAAISGHNKRTITPRDGGWDDYRAAGGRGRWNKRHVYAG